MKNNKYRLFLITFVCLTMVFGLFSGSAYSIELDITGEVLRFEGSTRFSTSATVSSYLFDLSDAVVIARGDTAGNYADALAGSYLAGVLECPILLTAPDYLPASIATEITRLGATKAYILGGLGAVSQAVEDSLVGLDLDVIRLSGARREDTAAAIVNFASNLITVTTENPDNFAFVVNRQATADALVAGAYAYRYKIPILLVYSNSIPAITEATLQFLDPDQVDIVGGTGVVSDGVFNTLNSIYDAYRIAGSNRYLTSKVFAETMFPGAEHFAIVRGLDTNLADGISAAAFGVPILYVDKDTIGATVLAYLNQWIDGFSKIYILGGINAVGMNVETILKNILDAVPPMTHYIVIQNDGGSVILEAEIDNAANTIYLPLDSSHESVQFTTGYATLSKSVYVTVGNTKDGMYDIASPGFLVNPEDDFVDIILSIFDDNPPTGVSGKTLMDNDGTWMKLTDANDATNSRTYTLILQNTR